METKLLATGLREITRDLRTVDERLHNDLERGLEHAGDVVRDEARRRFDLYGQTLGKGAQFAQSAATFETRVRARGRVRELVFVTQRRRKTRRPGRKRPNYGGLQMRHGLIPAREAKLGEAARIVERDVVETLRQRGF